MIVDSLFLLLLLPLSRDKLMDEGFEVTSQTGNKLNYDLKSKIFDNKNAFVIGPTGSGKSLLIQHMIDSFLEKNENVIVLDKGESYRKLCMYHEGLMLERSLNFLIFKDPQYLRDLVVEIAGTTQFSAIDKGRLYDWINLGLKNNSFNTHDEFINYLDEEFKDIKYYFSDVRKFFTDESCEFLDSKFICCEVKKYPKKMQGAVILFLFQFFDNFNGNVNFIFEEIHNYLLTTPDSIVGTISREIRKEGGALIAVTQSVNDTKIYPLLAVLWDNCHHKFFFRHESDPSNDYISGFEREQFLSLSNTSFVNNNSIKNEVKKYSEFLISGRPFSKIVRLYVSKENYEIYTTNPDDRSMFDSWFNLNSLAFSDFKSAIKSYTRLKYEH